MRRNAFCSSLRLIFSVAVAVAAFVVLSISPLATAAESAKLLPRPDAAAMAKAEKEMAETFGGEIAAAKLPSQKAKLAKELLALAVSEENNNAARLVVCVMARDLAVQGRDKATAFAASVAIAERFEPEGADDGPTDGQGQFERAQSEWKEAEKAKGESKLALQARAIEWYAYAKPTATGINRLLVEKRMKVEEAAGAAARVVKAEGKQTAKAKGKDDDLKLLIGTWKVHIQGPSGRHETEWTFRSDGVIDSTKGIKTGYWKAEHNRVTVLWGGDSWETLNRPIASRIASGDSKNFGPQSVIATKQ
jgi:hypothetical protein